MAGFDYDLFVIGGGSGGVRAARIAAGEHGARVGLAEESRMGGTCVIRGCVPKKLMVFASAVPDALALGRDYGWNIAEARFDWPTFRARLDGELDRLEAAYRGGLVNAGVTIHDSRATLVDPHAVRLATGEIFTAKHVLIATGGRPQVPVGLGAPVLTSNDVFLMDRLPETLLIVGGGFIACEFAQVMAGLGVRVTQFYRGEQILRGFDDDARAMIADEIRKSGVDLVTGTDVAALVQDGGRTRVTRTDGRMAHFDAVLYATGRAPNTEGLGLQALGIELGPRGQIPVDDWSQTAVPSIFAVGDVTDRLNLTPVAIREGHAFADTVFGARPHRPDHRLVPAAVFTRPELGAVGLTEAEAARRGPVEIYQTAFRPMKTAFAGHPERVLMKLVVDAESRVVLGCHIVAPDAGEMIQLAGIAVRMGATKEDFDRTCAVHPTMAEELVTMRKATRSHGILAKG